MSTIKLKISDQQDPLVFLGGMLFILCGVVCAGVSWLFLHFIIGSDPFFLTAEILYPNAYPEVLRLQDSIPFATDAYFFLAICTPFLLGLGARKIYILLLQSYRSGDYNSVMRYIVQRGQYLFGGYLVFCALVSVIFLLPRFFFVVCVLAGCIAGYSLWLWAFRRNTFFEKKINIVMLGLLYSFGAVLCAYLVALLIFFVHSL